MKGNRLPRKTLSQIKHIPTPSQLYEELMSSKGWHYKTNMEYYLVRDRALASLLYLGDFRVSEVIPLTLENFVQKKGHVLVHSIKVSKRRRLEYREAKLPVKGERKCFTDLIMKYLDIMRIYKKKRLFPWSLKQAKYKCGTYALRDGTVKTCYSIGIVGTKRAWQIINALLPDYTQHWLRAFGYNFDYDHMDHDIMAVSDKTKADPRSLQSYLRRRYEKYEVV